MNKLQVANLDFDGIKADLRFFLQSQTQFKDYNFEGSGLAVLIDILAYNTQYQAFYMNMLANEMFIDSADIRSSVVSIAKHLNYTPRSIKASQAIIDITITPPVGDSTAVAVLERNTRFTATTNGITYTFVTDRTYSVGKDATTSQFKFYGVILNQGIPYTYRWEVDDSIYKQKFVIPNKNIDTAVMLVRVKEALSSNLLSVYNRAADITEIKGDSLVYFLQQNEDERYEIYFGDDVIGKKLQHGNIVNVDYLVTVGPDANYASFFTPSSYVAGYPSGQVVVTTINESFGGAVAESIEEIRFAAPKNYEAQNRAVTVQDYKTLIQHDYPDVDSIAIWGGEQHDPPMYGRVFISLKPKKGYVITQVVKQTVLKQVLRERNVVTVIPEIMDPDYMFILIATRVRYDPRLTSYAQGDIRNLVASAIQTFSTQEISKFELSLRYSRLCTAIDNADPSITNNWTRLQMEKRFVPKMNVIANYEFDFNNQIQPKTFVTSTLYFTQDPLITYVDGDSHKIMDDGNGKLNIIKMYPGHVDEIVRSAGTIDYNTGKVKFVEIIPYAMDGDFVSMRCTPTENDIVPYRNTILMIEPEDVVIRVETSTSLVTK